MERCCNGFKASNNVFYVIILPIYEQNNLNINTCKTNKFIFQIYTKV